MKIPLFVFIVLLVISSVRSMLLIPRVLQTNSLRKVARKVVGGSIRNQWNSVENANQLAHKSLININSEGEEKGLVAKNGDSSPTTNPIIVLGTNKRPIFPGYKSQLFLRDDATIEAVLRNKEKEGGYLGVFLRNDDLPLDAHPEILTDPAQIFKVGTFAQITEINKTGLGTQLVLMGHRRINFNSFVSFGPPAIAEVTHWKRPVIDKLSSLNLKAYVNEVMVVVRELIMYNPLLQEMLTHWVSRIDFSDPYKLADFATALTSPEGFELQRVLEAELPEERLSLVLELLTKERELVKLQREISRQVEEKVSKTQREYFLREQLKSIKKELGLEKDDKEDLISKYQTKLKEFADRGVAETTLKAIGDEVKKLEFADKQGSEFNVIRSYLDWLVAMPWGKSSVDMLHLARAKTILDEDHFGLDEVKKRILEFIAVGKLKGTVQGKILCFVGPPGVGKTSIAKSIARALDKKFYRFSVGGLTDVAEIKGHRRTYVGAMPGKPVQCLKHTECINPLILIDEIDKVGKGHNGDPSSALLELLDPNQNDSFVDHYLDVPMDFSTVLFVCTANDESAIPGPLRDRMEMIRLTGYDIPEKVAIASRYLVPKAFLEAGLNVDSKPTATPTATTAAGVVKTEPTVASTPVDAAIGATEESPSDLVKSALSKKTKKIAAPSVVPTISVTPSAAAPPTYRYEITDEALELLVKSYSRESGVRSLEKVIERVARKLAYSRVTQDEINNPSDSPITNNTPPLAANAPLPSASEIALTKTGKVRKNAKAVKSSVTTTTATTETAPSTSPVEPIVFTVTVDNLHEFAGKPSFTQETIYDSQGDGPLPVGVVMGLAWDPMGGCPIFIETAALPVTFSESGGGVHTITGQLGNVMKESVNIAYTFARQFVRTTEGHEDSKFFNSHQLHVHVPEGAVSKDGPSAGVAMTTSMISMATGTPVRAKLAMTGEISLTGKVLPVGGIKEKALAARRSGAKAILLPLGNKKDFEELPLYVREHLEVHYASEYSDVYKLAFPKKKEEEKQ